MTPTHRQTNRYRTLALVGGVLLLATTASAQPSVPSGFTARVFVSGVSNPTAMEFAPDGRLFVCEQGGALRVVKNGTLLPTAFRTLTVNSDGERGLLGVAFDPNFVSNQFVYVYYTTASAPLHNRVSRFTANGDVAQAGSEVVILDLDNLSGATNHNGGAIHFGMDGKLYVAVGDNANSANATSMTTRHGKMLRINADGSIPSDNPFFATASGANRAVWALGLRNPFTFAVQPGPGRILINDVGSGSWEEINDGLAGANYGWPTTEGEFSQAAFPNFRNPLLAYPHSGAAPSGCAITGGTFYNPTSLHFPSGYEGDYFYADNCSGFFRHYDPATDTDTAFGTGLSGPVDLKVGPDGGLYTLSRGGGVVHKIEYPANLVPVVTDDPLDQAVAVGQAATFTVTASGASPLGYQWQRNGVDIAGATSSTYTLANAQTTDNGARFRCRVSNTSGNDTSAEALLTVTAPASPTLAVNATTVSPGQQVQGTVQNGPGNRTDWVALHVSTGGDTAFLDWKYLNGTRTAPATGSTSATLSFAMPQAPGTYNLRLFRNNTYTRLATSALVTVQAAATPTLTLLTATVTPGQTFQVTVGNGPGNAKDWLGLHATNGTDTAILDWKYLNGSRIAPLTPVTAGTIAFQAPSTPGTYNIRFFQNNAYSKLATSATLTVQAAASPTLTLSATTITRGGQVQVTVASGPGNPGDWLGLHAATAADSSYLDWKYLNGARTVPASGLTSATVTFTMPQAPGTYNIRLFRNGGYARLATSVQVTVQ